MCSLHGYSSVVAVVAVVAEQAEVEVAVVPVYPVVEAPTVGLIGAEARSTAAKAGFALG